MIKSYFLALWGSLVSPQYYAELKNKSFWYTFKIYVVTFLLLTAVFTIAGGYLFHQSVGQYAPDFVQDLKNIYPSELVVTVENGIVSSNVSEPYFIPISRLQESRYLNELFKDVEAENEMGETSIENLIVIDTRGSVEDFYSYQTFMLVTDNSISVVGKEGRIETTVLTEEVSGVVDQSVVDSVILSLISASHFLTPLVVAFTFGAFTFFFPVMFMSMLLWYAIPVLFGARFGSLKLSYGQSYQYAMHMILPVCAITILLAVFGITLSFPFSTSLLFGLVAFGFAYGAKSNSDLPSMGAAIPSTSTQTAKTHIKHSASKTIKTKKS